MYNSYYATLKTPYLLLNDHKTFQEHDMQAKSDNKKLEKMAKKKFQLGNFSSVSARKLKCPSSARLGSEPSQLGSTRAGKFQLGLITKLGSYMFSNEMDALFLQFNQNVTTDCNWNYACMQNCYIHCKYLQVQSFRG